MPAGRLVFAGVSGSPGSVNALRRAADLARQHDAILVPLLAWVPPGGDMADRRTPDLQLRQLWEHDAGQRLRDAIDAAFGGFPHCLRTWPLVRRGPAGKVLVSAASQASDLLVIGTGGRGPLRRPIGCHVSGYCLARAHCPVVAVPPPTLTREVGRGLRGWAFRHRGPDPDTASLPRVSS